MPNTQDFTVRDHLKTKTSIALRSGLILAVTGTALFAMKSIFIKLAYAEGVDTITLLTLRMLIAFPVYLLILLWLIRHNNQGKAVPGINQLPTILLLGFSGYYLASFLDMEGLNHISAQLERLTLYTYPIMTTLLSWLILKEKITRNIIIALLLTYAGIAIIYAHEALTQTENTHLGVLLVSLSALTFSFYVVFGKMQIERFGSRLFTSIAMLASTFFVLMHFAVTHSITDLRVSREVLIYAVLLSIFSTILPSYMVSEAISRIGAAKTSIVGTLGPVFTILLAVILLGEPFGWQHLAGLILVVGGVSLLGKR